MKELKDEISRLHAENAALQQVLVAALEEARSAINSMKVEAETAGQGDEQMMLEACETISNEGLQADMAIRAALASAPRPVPSAARPVTPYTCPKCHALWLHWPAEQTGFGRDTLNCRSTAHCHYCENGGVEQLQRLERVPAVLSAPQPSPTPQADSQPAPTYKDSTPELHVGDSAFESWYSTYNPAHKSDKQRARDAYAAGMGDPLVMAAPVAQGDAEDAARYRFLAGHCRSTSEHWGGRWSIIVDGPAPKSHDSEDDFDEAVDAARKQGANHD